MSSVSILRLLTQFFVVPVLSRILSPADYGVVAMAMPFVLFTMIFTDAGVGQSLVRSKDKDETVWSSSFWLTVCLGLGLALFIAALAPAAAWFFDEARLLPIVLALTPVVLLQASCAIPEVAMRHSHRFGRIAITEITAMAISIGTAVAVALHGGGAWALVAQQLAMYSVRFVLTFTFSPFRPRLVFSFAGLREHLVFGRNVLGTSFVYYLSNTVNPFVIGKILGSALLGFYTMTFLFVNLPVRIVTGPLQYVLYAHLAPHGDDPVLVRRMLLFLTRALSVVVFPAMAMVAAAHEPLFTLLLSDKWQLAGSLFALAAPAAAIQAVSGLRGTFMMVIGRADIQLRAAIEYFLIMLCVLMVSVHFGLEWVVAGYALSVFLFLPRGMMLSLPRLGCRATHYLGSMVPSALPALAAAAFYAEIAAPHLSGDWAKAGAAFAIGLAALGCGAALQFGRLRSDALELRTLWAGAH